MSLEIPSTRSSSLQVTAQHDGDVIRVRLIGQADIEAKADVDTLMEALHAETLRLHVRRVCVDFHDVEFMNSSCFKAFVSWLANVQSLPLGRQYRVHFTSNPQVFWQKRTLASLAFFAADLVTIEPE